MLNKDEDLGLWAVVVVVFQDAAVVDMAESGDGLP